MMKYGEDFLSLKREVHKWLIGTMSDPIALILIKNCHLTKTQLETFLIDILVENIAEKRIIYEEKAKLRLLKSGTSRGSFNRTLRQAKTNIIRSMYTLILLGYLGVFESPRLGPYIELANKLHTYSEAYKGLWNEKDTKSEHMRVMKILQKELEKGLKQLIEPKKMSKNT